MNHHHSHPSPSFNASSPEAKRSSLPKGSGQGKLLFFDAPSGLAGDMIVASLVDLGVPASVVEEAVAAFQLKGVRLEWGTKTRSGIVAMSFHVHTEEEQPERTYADLYHLIEEAPLDPRVRTTAHATFRKLAEAEARVHRAPISEVHFHEVGGVDALVDVVGSAAALVYLKAELLVSPLPMGRGVVPVRHGILPLPAPAVLECLTGFTTYDGGLDFEFVTPTGAAIVAAHAHESIRWPDFAPERAGWGAGTAELPDRANLLRAVLGTKGHQTNHTSTEPSHTVLEANLDDITGELLAHCIEKLLTAGAVDAWVTPITTKKGRPAYILSALTPVAQTEQIATALLAESTSIGVRSYDVRRVERPRHHIEVNTAYGAIPIKVSSGPYGSPQIKPEFSACAAAAEMHNVPVRDVIRAALAAFEEQASHS